MKSGFLIVLFLLIFVGCSSAPAKHRGSVTFENYPGTVEFVSVKDRDFLGQDIVIVHAWFFEEGHDPVHLGSNYSSGPGAGKSILPAAANAAGYAAGQALRRPDEVNISQTGGGANAQGGAGGAGGNSTGANAVANGGDAVAHGGNANSNSTSSADADANQSQGQGQSQGQQNVEPCGDP